MNTVIVLVSLLTVNGRTHAQTPGHEVHVHTLVQQTGSNAAPTVIVFENAKDMVKK